MNKTYCILTYFLGWMLLPQMLHGQGTERYFGGPGPDRFLGIAGTPDGGFALAGNTAAHLDSLSDMLLIRTDASGNLIYEKHLGHPNQFESANAIATAADGGFLLAGEISDAPTGLRYMQAVHTDAFGNVQWTWQSNTATEYSTAVLSTPDGGWLLGGIHQNTANFEERSFSIYKLTDVGAIAWSWQGVPPAVPMGFFTNAFVSNLYPAANGGCYMCGGGQVSLSGGGNRFFYFTLHFDANGQIIGYFPTDYAAFDPDEIADAAGAAPFGNFAFAGRSTGNILHLFDPNGQLLQEKTLALPGLSTLKDIETDGNRIALAGETQASNTTPRDALLAVTDAAGNLLFSHTYGGISGDFFRAVLPTATGGFALAGQTSSFGDGSINAYLVIADSLGNALSNHIRGRVHIDSNLDCAADTSDLGAAGWLVEARSPQALRYGLTDSLGYFDVLSDSGTWHLSVRPPSAYWSPCVDSVAVFFAQIGIDTVMDVAVQPEIACPLLYVDVGVPFLRRCFDNVFHVQYHNYGTALATDAYVAVALDPWLEIVDADLPYQSNSTGDTLFFGLGDVPLFGGGHFSFTTYLNCDSTVIGQTHCVSAHIFPDSNCFTINPIWDNSDLSVTGYCAGDSVVLTIHNNGVGGMDSPAEYVITEDLIIIKKSPVQLAAGQDTTIVVRPNGGTVMLQIMQQPGHPVGGNAVIIIEGCGSGAAYNGFALAVPQNDLAPWFDMECRQNIGSFDPNDKSAVPIGIGENEHRLLPNTDLEYLIQFQNTGTDTAFRVEIRDTLSPLLDLKGIRLGASSHPYRFSVGGNGALAFTFDPIALPDSTVNEPASHGFIKFRIPQKNNLPTGTRLENRAAIYFDFNAPVLTNVVFHTIDTDLVWQTVGAPETGLLPLPTDQVFFSPNPFTEQTFLHWGSEQEAGQVFSVRIFNTFGQAVQHAATVGNSYVLKKNNLPSGVYCAEIFGKNGHVWRGKVVLL